MRKMFVTCFGLALCAGLLASAAPARAQEDEDDRVGFERVPPRLSFVDGDVSFLRPGAEDWTPARVNTALAAGDELYTDEGANLELQIGGRAFVRAGETTQLGLTSLEPDFLQLRVMAGHVSLDLRALKSGQTFELDTPNAAFTVERSGYYRIEVEDETTTITSRRGGRATVTPASGDSVTIGASEQVVVSGTDAPQVESYAAPELDAWDRWNYARTDEQLDAVSARYVPSDVYGADDLDHHGDWRVVPSYGAVWVPRHVAVGWAPYSTGRWLFDPYYGWTWVDDAPWGWAPYHYGRWVHISSYWGWCPGPVVVRPYYAPALVAFYGGGGLSVGVTIGRPHIGWVALGWGEPLIPWWGPRRFREHPHWAGWGGPRVVNKQVVKNKTVIKLKNVNVYQNADVNGALVAVDRDQFGRRSQKGGGFERVKAEKLEPLHGDLDVKPDRSSLVAETRAAKRPPKEARRRSVVATREPRLAPVPGLESGRGAKKEKQGSGVASAEAGAPDAMPTPRVVKSPEGKRGEKSKRAPFGTRSEGEVRIPAPPPRFEKAKASPDSKARDERAQPGAPEGKHSGERATQVPSQPNAQTEARSRREASPPPKAPKQRVERTKPERGGRYEQPSSPPRDLPGEPANRVYRQRSPERHGSVSRQSERVERAPKAERVREERVRSEGGGDSEAEQQGRSRRR